MLCAQQTPRISGNDEVCPQEIAEVFGEACTEGGLESEQLADTTVFEDVHASEDFSQVTNKSVSDLIVSFRVCGCCKTLFKTSVDKSCCYDSYSSFSKD